MRAVGYVRVSTDKQLDNTSIAKQTEEIKRYCDSNDITLVHIFDEGAKSAKSFRNRDAFKELYSFIMDKKNKIDCVVVYDSDRISRDNLEALYIYKRLNEEEIRLICIADNIDTSDPRSKILYQIMSLVAELERDMIIFRTSSGMEKRASEGHFNGGIIYGYTSSNKKLKIVPEEAKVVSFIFDKYANEQWGYKKIASALNTLGIRTKKDNYWTIFAVKTILSNPIYIGNMKWRGELRKGKHAPIIDVTLWEKAQSIMKLNSHLHEKIHPGSFPLSGLLRCPQCGAPMVQGNSSPKYKYYQCSRNKNSGSSACLANLISKEYAEKAVYEQVFTTLQKHNLIEPLINTLHSYSINEVMPLQQQIKKQEADLVDLKRKRKELINWRMRDIITEEIFEEEMHDLQQEEQALVKQIESLNQQIKLSDKQFLTTIVANSLKDFLQFFSMIKDDDKKILLQSLIKKIHVNPGDKPKNRTIKDIIYKFDLTYLNQVI
ncbi:recombinase family protein [Solibacillus sp. FSL W7-1464]|uniref:recombinase family protein n=1 Tax=unclassified Solibacillus TaxID=2637870 RepID=UPI0030FA2A61